MVRALALESVTKANSGRMASKTINLVLVCGATLSGHVALFPTVETLNAAVVHATGNQVIGLRIGSEVTEGMRSHLGIGGCGMPVAIYPDARDCDTYQRQFCRC